MMDVKPEIKAALSAESLRFAWLIDLPEGIHLTDHARDLAFDGRSYVSQGDILTLPSIVREREIKLQSYTMTLSNTDLGVGTPLDKLSSRNYTGTACEVRLVLLNPDDSIIGNDAISLYKGTFHTWSERETDKSSTMTISLTSPWSKPNLTAGRVTSTNNQEERYANDKFFRWAHRERDNLGWGAKD